MRSRCALNFSDCIIDLRISPLATYVFAKMSASLEEQEGEIEVLQSIYEDNFRLHSSKPPHHFEIELHTLPTIHQKLPFSKFATSRASLMIRTWICVQQKLDEFTDQLIAEVKTRKEEQKKIKSLAEAEREREVERRLVSGTRVTVESFNAWNKAFLAEMAKAKKEAEEAKAKKLGASGGGGQNTELMKRITGREMFLRDDQFVDSDLTFLAQEGGEIVEVDERLFTDIGEIDISDIEES
ncbi:hypothetical protein TcWFU_008492 [Taenia crassiceps]|uniref:RWD domain-containing protein n=1 Tax=Taenia crassiceps TaxID=6207 RepID=A0ABR4QMC4_9CEST